MWGGEGGGGGVSDTRRKSLGKGEAKKVAEKSLVPTGGEFEIQNK